MIIDPNDGQLTENDLLRQYKKNALSNSSMERVVKSPTNPPKCPPPPNAWTLTEFIPNSAQNLLEYCPNVDEFQAFNI